MTDFIITAPDGRKFKVSGPDQAGAVAALKKMLGGPPSNDTNIQRARDARAGTLPAATTDTSAADRIAEDQMTLSQTPGLLRGFDKAVQGLPFVGEYTDELMGAVGNAVQPGRGDSAMALMRETRDAMDRQNPKTSAALMMAGGVAGSIPLLAVGGGGAKAAEFVGKGASLVTKGLRAAAVGGAAAGSEGAVSGFGAGDDGDRLGSAAQRGAIGAGLGGVLGVLAPLVGVGAASLAKRFKKLDVSAIANEFGISPNAARVMRRYLQNDDLDAATKMLARGGDDAMLANAGPSTRQALDTAMSSGGEALAVGRARVGEATNKASGKLLTTIDDILGTADGGIKGAARKASQASAPARKMAYDFTYAQPRPMVGEAAERIDGVLARISPEDMQAAIKAANRSMLNDGRVNQNIVASIAADGSVTYAKPLSVMHLDYIKRGLRSMANAEKDLKGAVSDAGRIFGSQASDLGRALNEGVNGYSAAMKLGGDNALTQEGLDIGRTLLNSKTTVEDVRNFMKGGVSDEVRAAVKKGFRENLDDLMGRARTTIGDMESGAMDFETGINASAEAIAAVKNMLNRNNMTKARFAIGSDSTRLFAEIEKMTDALVLRASVAKGSATAIRTAGQRQMADEVAPGIVRRVAGNLGNPLDAGKELTQSAIGIDARSIGADEAKYFAEIADALTRIRGPEAQAALAAVKRAMAGQPLKDADAQLIGRLTTGGTAILGHQAGTQSLARR